MGINLWQECLSCKDKCCKWDISKNLFVTAKELSKINGAFHNKEFNKRVPCVFLNKNELCSIHNIRPIDCRFFPFDILNINGYFYWVIWNLNCSIQNQKDFEPYLHELETEYIPKFQNYLEDYSKFRLEDLFNKYKFKVIRKVKIQPIILSH